MISTGNLTKVHYIDIEHHQHAIHSRQIHRDFVNSQKHLACPKTMNHLLQKTVVSDCAQKTLKNYDFSNM